MTYRRTRAIFIKELHHITRDSRSLALALAMPFMMLLLYGYALSLDVDHARIAWRDMSRTPASRALRARFEGSGRFEIVALATSDHEVQSLLDHSDVHAVVSVLPTFARELARGGSAQVQVLLDGTDSNTASLVSAYAAGVIAGFSEDVSLNPSKNHQMIQVTLRNSGTGRNPIQGGIVPNTRVWFNPELRSRNFFIPGVAANLLLMLTMMLTAQAIIREKEIGTLEQLMVTPMRPVELILGKTLPFALIGLIDMMIVTGAALLLFNISFRGSFLLLLFCSLLYLMPSLGAGLYLSTISNTQQQANLGSFFITTPAFMLSGFAFPISNMPVAVQYLTYLNPIRYFMEIVRGIFLKGAGISVLWPQMLILAVYGAAILALSVFRFHKTLD
ncbi:MAG: ABC transporter permease [Acidobacteria bacterium]|nr:ABC transporter permease [Acidobacteriota bacterium]